MQRLWRRARRAAAAAGAAAMLAGAGPGAAGSAEAPPSAEIRRVADGARLDLAALAAGARAHDLIVIGEIHDNPRHQAMQAALAEAAGVSALALEMVPRAAEAALAELRAAMRAGTATEVRRAAAGWAGYAPYHGVLAAAPGAPAAGGGLSREALRAAMETGAAAGFDGDPARWGLDAALPEAEQAALEAELLAAHCDALPGAMLPGMAEAQRLRDAAFAAALLRARAAAGGEAGGAAGVPKGPAMLVVGNGHARRDRGSPAFLARAAPALSVLAIAQVERRPGDTDWRDSLARWTPEGSGPPFDVVVVTDPEPREDPCARFRDRQD